MSDWHLDKKVNVGHIISTALLAIAAFGYINAIEKKIDANAINISTIKEQRKEDVRRIEKRLDSMDRKLDRLLEKK